MTERQTDIETDNKVTKQTDRWTSYCFIDPAPYTMWAVPRNNHWRMKINVHT